MANKISSLDYRHAGQYDRLGQLLAQIPKDAGTMSLPVPTGKVSVEQVMVVPPGSKNIVVRGVTMELSPGEALGIVGPSASGKSCLARALLGIWPAYSGKVRLDGADIASALIHDSIPHVLIMELNTC